MATIAGLTEDFGGAAPGVTVTTGNTAFTDVDTTAGAVAGTFNGDSYTGSLQSMNVTTSTQSSSHRIDHTAAGGWRGFGFKLITVDTSSTAGANWFAGAAKGGDFRFMPDRAVQLRNVSTSAWISPVLAATTWYWAAIRVAPTLRCKLYQAGSLFADSGDLTASSASTYDIFRLGHMSTSVAQTRFARLRGDDSTEPASGITASTAIAAYTRTDNHRVLVDTAGSSGTMTLSQNSGPAATITGPASGVFTVLLPSGFASSAVFTLTATSGAQTDVETITVNPVGAAGGALTRVFTSVGWTAEPTGEPPAPPPVTVDEGYDPATNGTPPERTQRAYHDNTGLYSQALRDALVQDAVSADLTTTSNGQVFEGRDFINDVVVAHSGVVFKYCRFRKGIDVGGLSVGSAPPKVIYCDAIHNNGTASTSVKNFVSGNAHVYRSNISGYLDNGAVKTVPDDTGHTTIFMDCFMHDSRLVDDPGQPGRSHNDSYQSNQPGTDAELVHCTIFGSGTNNFSAVESWTRSSGPHWTAGATPYDCTFDNPANGGDEVGRINAGACQLKAGGGDTFRLLRCLVAGSMFRVTNATDNPLTATDNEVATEHMDAGNYWAGGSNLTLSGNTNWLTGAPI